MGGTGKTPFTLLLAKYYMDKGEKVAILSRGYKGKLGYETHLISDGKEILHAPPLAADEPYMMALTLPGVIVVTGKKRIDSYRLAAEKLGATAFILDDGYQHQAMPRDVNILLLDHKKPFSTGFPFPFGYLREFPSAAKRADVVVFTRASDTELPQKVAHYINNKPCFFSNTKYKNFVSSQGSFPATNIKEKKVWMLSGIARPEEFKRSLEALSAQIIGQSVYRDHHAYKSHELIKEIENAGAKGAEFLITTAKDYVKIPPQYAKDFIYPEMEVEMLSEGFLETVDKLLN